MSTSFHSSTFLVLPGALLLALAAMNCHGASFDCSKAGTPVETAICSDKELSVLDDRLSSEYQRALASAFGSDKAGLQADQRKWLGSVRNACQDVRCLVGAYNDRIGDLSGAARPPSSGARPTPADAAPRKGSDKLKCEFKWDTVALDIPMKVKAYFRDDIPDDSKWVNTEKYAYHDDISVVDKPDGGKISNNVTIRIYRDGSITVRTLLIDYPANAGLHQDKIKYQESKEVALGSCRPTSRALTSGRNDQVSHDESQLMGSWRCSGRALVFRRDSSGAQEFVSISRFKGDLAPSFDPSMAALGDIYERGKYSFDTSSRLLRLDERAVGVAVSPEDAATFKAFRDASGKPDNYKETRIGKFGVTETKKETYRVFRVLSLSPTRLSLVLQESRIEGGKVTEYKPGDTNPPASCEKQ